MAGINKSVYEVQMDFHYSDLCIPTNHILTDYHTEYHAHTHTYLPPAQNAEYEVRSSILVDGGDRYGVSSVVFDKFEELVWMGNQGGHVTSYFGPSMQKYTSFQVHESDEVRDIITVERGIYALTKSTLRHQIRRGIPKHTFRSDNMTDMQCLFEVSKTRLLMGGHQDKLLDLDLNKMKEIVIPIEQEGCAVLRSGGGSLVACGSADGTVSLRDLRNLRKAEHSFRAHSACLSDLDMQGDLLITCGFTQTGSVAVAEPYVVVWDVRYLRGSLTGSDGAWSIPTASPPLLLHFLPVFSGRAAAISGDGHVALMQVNAPSTIDSQSVFQVDTQSSLCSVMDVSSTSQALVFGNQGGHLHLFSAQHNHEPVYNNFSRQTEFADPMPGLPYTRVTDNNFNLSTVSLPPLTSGKKWFNELSEEFFKRIYRKPREIDPEVAKSMKMQGPIGYAPNPKARKRNQIPYVPDTLEDLKTKSEDKHRAQPIPKHYQKLDIRINKHGPNDDLEQCNKTGLPGLEATLPNSYCNPMLQVLYYMPALKSTLLAHTCAKEFCLSCELGFLFRMLDTSGGAPCQASNFLRAFRTVPEAAALGLILPDRGTDQRVDLVSLIQSWIRFILHQIHYEILETRKKEKELALLANSPPKPRILKVNRLTNGYTEDYHYTELEFLAPTEYEPEVYREGVEGPWRNPEEVVVPEAIPPLPVQAVNNHELPNNQNSTSSSTKDREESEISQLFAIGRHQLNRCLKCNKEEERESVVLACALQYNTPPSREGEARGFIELVRASLAARRSTPAWCEHCARFTPTTQRGRIVRLPPILAINCGGMSAHEKAFWTKGPQKEPSEISKRGGSSKPCRYGLHCARPGCRFKHPERPMAPAPATAMKSSTQEFSCVLPHTLNIRLQADGDIVINDKCDLSPSEPNRLAGGAGGAGGKEQQYQLSAAVVCVEDNPRNLVAYVRLPHAPPPRTPHPPHPPQPPHPPAQQHPAWYLFNDLSIVSVSAEEVVQLGAWWKSPCVLFYSSRAS